VAMLNTRALTACAFMACASLGCLVTDTSWAQGELSFTRQDFAVGDGPFSVTTGDFNGDSQQDLATANRNANTVSILLGNGDGTFEPAQDFGVGGPPESITVGDFNGDSQQDLATAINVDGNSVSILLGQGDGTFEPAQHFAVGGTASSVTVGDFNSDSQQDLATANPFGGVSFGGTVSILLGNGDGTFEPAQDFAVVTARSITVGDFNSDGQQDVATANLIGTVSILLGQGDGTFEPAQDFGVGGLAVSVTVGDFNSDGQQDVATANFDPDTVSILINNTAVEIAVKIDIKPGNFPNSINPRSKGVIPVAVLTTDTFDASAVDPTTAFFGATGTEVAPVHSALEDVDGDGNSDLILHFRAQGTGIVCGDTSASVTAKTFVGQAIEGSDSIRTVGCKKQ
jgi:large repetitive protein